MTLLSWRTRRRLIVKGREHLDAIDPPAIFVANHTSDWDGPMIRSVLPMFSKWGPMFYVALTRDYYKAKHRHVFSRLFFGGVLFTLVGAYPVYKGTGDLRRALMHHLKILEDGGPVVIFPEGREVRTGSVGDFRVGVAYLAALTGAPCIPVAISGFNKAEVENGIVPPGDLCLTFGEPVYYSATLVGGEPDAEDLLTFARSLKDRVERLRASHRPPKGL